MPRSLLRARRFDHRCGPGRRILIQGSLGVELLEERCVLSAAHSSDTNDAYVDPVLNSDLAFSEPPSVTVGPLFTVSDMATSEFSTYGAVGPNGNIAIGWDGSTDRLRFFDHSNQPQGSSLAVGTTRIRSVEFDSLGRTVATGLNFSREGQAIQYSPDGQVLRSGIYTPSEPRYRLIGDAGVDRAGNVVATWSELNPTSGQPDGMYGQRLDANLQKIGAPFPLNSTPEDFLEGWLPPISMAMNASGDFVVTWDFLGPATPSTYIYARRFNADGTPKGDQFVVNPTLGGGNQYEHVAMDSEGNFVVVWWHVSTNGVALYGQWFGANGNRRGNERNLSVTLAQEALPRIAMDGVGNSILVWSTNNQSIAMAQAFGAEGQKLGGEIQLHTATSNNIFPNIGMSEAGEAIASWSVGTSVFARRLSFGYDTVIDLNGGAAGRDYRTQRSPGGGSVPIVDTARLTVTSSSATNIVSAKISIGDYRPGDVLTINTSGTSISASFAGGVLSLSGEGTAGQYQKVLRTVRFGTTAPRPASSTVEIRFVVNDGFYDSNLATTRIEIYVPGSAAVAARRLFYNDSMFDFNDPAIGNPDDKATPNKTAYLPGSGLATFASVSSYSKGINGIMIDLAGTHGEISLADLEFRVGTSASPDNWNVAPAPSGIALRPGWGPGGSDRLEVVWPNNSIMNQWLEVRVKANAHTGLAIDDLFYWANRIGDVGAGAPAGVFLTSAVDATAVLNQLGHARVVDALADFNRDGVVSAIDKMIVMGSFGSLVRLNLGNVAATLAGDSGIASALATTSGMTSDAHALPTAQEPPRAAIKLEAAARGVTPADQVTASTKAARLARAADLALSLQDGWDEPAELLVDRRI